MSASPTAVQVFSHALLVAIRVALTAKTPRAFKQAQFSAYANARAAARAALLVLRDEGQR